MIHQFDHRFGSYETRGNERGFSTLPATPLEKYQDPNYIIHPFYHVKRMDVEARLVGLWDKKWILVFRSIASGIVERTFISTIIPRVGVGNSNIIVITQERRVSHLSSLLSNLNNIVFDYIARQKIPGVNMNFFIVYQLPVIPPDAYSKVDIDFIAPRVLELVYTAWDLKPFAEDMGYDGPPFKWDEERRALLQAELDAYYAKLYGLTRDELRYILDPQDVYGPNFPGETFRVLKEKEIKQFGEYRTRRLVLEAWDRLFGER